MSSGHRVTAMWWFGAMQGMEGRGHTTQTDQSHALENRKPTEYYPYKTRACVPIRHSSFTAEEARSGLEGDVQRYRLINFGWQHLWQHLQQPPSTSGHHLLCW